MTLSERLLLQRLEKLKQGETEAILKAAPEYLNRTKTPLFDVVYLTTQSPTFPDIVELVVKGKIPVEDLTPAGRIAFAIKVG